MAGVALHGVNLTGWLTLEPWVTPELFADSGALDEEALVEAVGEKRYAAIVEEHRAEFITRDDFMRIAARGFNAVRLSVPWYAFGDDGPEHGPYVGCIEHVDDALGWAEEIGLNVIFSLAINPGAAHDREVMCRDLADMGLSRGTALDVVYRLSKRYAHRTGFYGIEVADNVVVQRRVGFSLTDGVPQHQLRNYYREAYELVRNAAGDEPVVIMPDGGFPAGFTNFMAQRHYRNVWVDTHMDHGFGKHIDVTGPSGVRRLVDAQKKVLRAAAKTGMPVMVGKWSSALPVADAQMTPEGRIALERVYASEQLGAYGGCAAWFFSTWKTSGLLTNWDARVALSSFERGMIV
ncbi:glucan 1,3-beta-glucosidase [Paratractidigestivibacter sp.]|uniref:glycoside hydrolase family 5 protein n=1 Tax=Paratractidigestivibacter sp. TaxID=2847316 RepID=UPI002ABDE102|nr:glucan 1,3-beta-glucosidase [Paratractidigestivibacter sp.]